MQTVTPEVKGNWHQDWQSQEHAVAFDGRSGLDLRNLIREYEAFNDVQLLTERLSRSTRIGLLEIGCATGEFYRYLRTAYPHVRYAGVDISRPAVARARAKYPHGIFVATDPSMPLAERLSEAGVHPCPETVYAKDVVHHQTRPFELLSELLGMASEALIIRTRTRDVGPTELDPERSCQYHYGGWMPYIVFNMQELIERIREEAPASEVVVRRHHVVLGGRYHRFLPKELYLKETGTAESAVGVFKTTDRAGRATIADRRERAPRYTWDYRLKHALRQAVDAWRPPQTRDAEI